MISGIKLLPVLVSMYSDVVGKSRIALLMSGLVSCMSGPVLCELQDLYFRCVALCCGSILCIANTFERSLCVCGLVFSVSDVCDLYCGCVNLLFGRQDLHPSSQDLYFASGLDILDVCMIIGCLNTWSAAEDVWSACKPVALPLGLQNGERQPDGACSVGVRGQTGRQTGRLAGMAGRQAGEPCRQGERRKKHRRPRRSKKI
jgi:hypothetical protein